MESISLVSFFLMAFFIFEAYGQDQIENQKDYYVNIDGDDTNPGTFSLPWKTLNKVSLQELEPGSTVYLAGNQVFEGFLTFSLEDSGTSADKVLITSYGDGRALINAGNGNGITLSNLSHLNIENIDVIGNGRKLGNTENGVLVYNSTFVNIKHMDIAGFQHSGLHINQSDDINITYVDAHDNGFAGIHSFGTWLGKRNTNIYIGYCTAKNNPGDPTVLNNHSGNGIVAGESDNVTIEYCVAENNGWDMPRSGNGPVGIWIWHSNNSVIQYCISKENKTSYNGSDGGGFDFDGGVTNSVLQYNISYGNQGAGIGLYQFRGASSWENNIIRYNVSENDGLKHGGGINVWNGNHNESSSMKSAYIHNNVVYNVDESPIVYFNHGLKDFNFFNNIFVHNKDGINGTINTFKEKYIGNLWYKLDGEFLVDGYTNFIDWVNETGNEKYNEETVGLHANPYFNQMGNTSIIDPLEIPNYDSYKLTNRSPAIDVGLNPNDLFDIPSNIQDLFGNIPLENQIFDMGVHEFQSKESTLPQNDIVLSIDDFNDAEFKNSQSDHFYLLDNPVKNNSINFFYSSKKAHKYENTVTVQLINLAGQYFYNKELKMDINEASYEINMDSAPAPGVYILILKHGNIVYNKKVSML